MEPKQWAFLDILGENLHHYLILCYLTYQLAKKPYRFEMID